jgi:hypothetical protein
MGQGNWVTIKVPRAAYEEALRLKDTLWHKGTKLLPPSLRPEGPLTIGHVFVLGVKVLQKALKPGIRKGRKA